MLPFHKPNLLVPGTPRHPIRWDCGSQLLFCLMSARSGGLLEIGFNEEGYGNHLLPAPKPPMKKQGTGISRLPVRNSIVAASGCAESSAAPAFIGSISEED